MGNAAVESRVCCFCREGQSEVGGRVVRSSPRFVAVPTVSPLGPGHLLILPRAHVTSLAQLGGALAAELLDFAENCVAAVTADFGSSLIFEHGVGAGSTGGCGIDHAHLHILPLDHAMIARTIDAIDTRFALGPPTRFIDAIQHTSPSDSYALVGTNLSAVRIAVASDIPSQFIRMTIANLQGRQSWDWRQLFGWDDFINTYNAMSPQRGTQRT
jgi:diadenosine tetraphosphate (Ap4A) HIT family hydrolase